MGSSDEDILGSQRKIRQLMFGFADSMALKCAVELRLADIIHSHGGTPLTLSQIASGIDSPNPDMAYLQRIMRYLAQKEIFSAHYPQVDGGETLYGPTQNSRWLLPESKARLDKILLMTLHPSLLAPWQCFAQCVKEGGTAFSKAHGCEIWDLASQNPELNRIFFDGLAANTERAASALLSSYKDGFNDIGSLVDVGGGAGKIVAEIVKAYPHIKGTNFDLPHVVAVAPPNDGVSHVAGDMFDAVPNADVVLMKGILHDWSDDDCVKILKNCRKAIPEKTGKLILIEIVLQPDDNLGLFFDLLMFAHTIGGRERTEVEWAKLLEEGGFRCCNIIKMPVVQSIIEAYPIM